MLLIIKNKKASSQRLDIKLRVVADFAINEIVRGSIFPLTMRGLPSANRRQLCMGFASFGFDGYDYEL